MFADSPRDFIPTTTILFLLPLHSFRRFFHSFFIFLQFYQFLKLKKKFFQLSFCHSPHPHQFNHPFSYLLNNFSFIHSSSLHLFTHSIINLSNHQPFNFTNQSSNTLNLLSFPTHPPITNIQPSNRSSITSHPSH